MLSAESRAPVAVFLVDHFPKLEDVCATRIPGDEVTDRWSDVQGMLAGLSRAREVDEFLREKGRTMGPLHGLPISLKDQFSMEGMETIMGGLLPDSVGVNLFLG